MTITYDILYMMKDFYSNFPQTEEIVLRAQKDGRFEAIAIVDEIFIKSAYSSKLYETPGEALFELYDILVGVRGLQNE